MYASCQPGLPRVMLMLGSDPTRHRLRGHIEASGAARVVAEPDSVAEAIIVLREQPLEVVVLDLRLWDSDIRSLLGELKKCRPACVVIVLTNFGSRSLLEHCPQLEADYFLDEAEDLGAVPRILSLQRRRSAALRPTPGAPGPDEGLQDGKTSLCFAQEVEP